ncbi:hypothetical protein L1Y55_02190, partial [Acinetobacter baumannii]|nr:hypothetical protein [Acinetobacter baumannii]
SLYALLKIAALILFISACVGFLSFVEFDESKDTSDFDTVKDNQTKRRFKGKSTGGGFKKAEGES